MLRQSISDFVLNIIQNVQSHQYHSIALPPIGCGHSNISSDFIIQTFLEQFIFQIKIRKLSLMIQFIILPHEKQIYQLFIQHIYKSEQSFN